MQMARKKVEEYRSSSYAYLPLSHSRMQVESFDRKDSSGGSPRDVIAEKYDPAGKADARYQMPA